MPKLIKYTLQAFEFLLGRIPATPSDPVLQPVYPTTTLTYPPSSPVSSDRTEVHNHETGVTTSSEIFNEGTPEETHVVVTRTPDTSAVNGPVTIRTQVTNTSGVIMDDTTVASPTGGNYPISALPDTSLPTPSPTTNSSRNSDADTDAGYGGEAADAGTDETSGYAG